MGNDLTSAFRPALVMTILFAVLLGIVYPLAMTGIGQTLFPSQANGSLVRDAQGRVIGSSVVGQAFTAERYFQTRPSAAGKGYDGLASSGSNLGPAAQALTDRVKPDVARHRADGITGPLPADLVTASGSGLDPDLSPADLVTASGSGLDPDLSPAAALAQAPRVARVRDLPIEQVRSLITAHTETSILGEPHVNVLALNRALDGLRR